MGSAAEKQEALKDCWVIGVDSVDGLRERSLRTENICEGGAKEVRNYLKVKHGPAYYK